MADAEVVRIGAQLITKDLGLADAELAQLHDITALQARLTEVVQHLLDRDFQRLVNAMYRIDLSESTFKEILASASPDKIAHTLAVQILERALQKAALRQRYRSG